VTIRDPQFRRRDLVLMVLSEQLQQQQLLASRVTNTAKWMLETFAAWQAIGEDATSVMQNPGFNNPAYPADDYTLVAAPAAGFKPFDLTRPGRSNPRIHPPAIPATFPTKSFNPATDF
jgi:hypothetical protein